MGCPCVGKGNVDPTDCFINTLPKSLANYDRVQVFLPLITLIIFIAMFKIIFRISVYVKHQANLYVIKKI